MNENINNIVEQEQEDVEKKIYYLYNGKKYELRAQVPYRNQFLLTLIEVE